MKAQEIDLEMRYIISDINRPNIFSAIILLFVYNLYIEWVTNNISS